MAAFKMTAVAPMSRISCSFTPNHYILRARCVQQAVRGNKGVLTDLCLTLYSYSYSVQFAATTCIGWAAIKSDADFVAASLRTVDGNCRSATVEIAALRNTRLYTCN